MDVEPDAGSDAGEDSADDGDVSIDDAADAGLNTCTQVGNNGYGLNCDDYCSTFISVCTPIPAYANFFVDKPDCMNKCATYNLAQICCRAEHVFLARDTAEAGADASTHCGHATGMTPCP
jgi:hypothetical protein